MSRLLSRQTDANVELLCALDGIRLCAPEYAIKKAEEVVAIWSAHTEADQDDFRALLHATTIARMWFLDAARHDLDYEPKKWYVLARCKEHRYLKKTEASSAQSLPGQ
ncbi:hypothetical protein YW3DRAFT_07111 [Streptomyces sp. MnatMP-M77]|uniref:hypothetical protein n=1 Tax=unclassified Streptomyces TaxID=2593676 RepID=UPI000805B102|nr:hypothetical protein [Streptomyces sp. MnatMP-M77]MYT79290.1 hypothetical protein [Streptomyces sp. SID8364]SBV03739.1 hypothetical protein YW3DRAFT_07111 [Streptomyces sp. MnatMP-M77]